MCQAEHIRFVSCNSELKMEGTAVGTKGAGEDKGDSIIGRKVSSSLLLYKTFFLNIEGRRK